MWKSLSEFSRDSYYSLRRRVKHYKNLLADPLPKILILAYHRVLPEVEFNPFATIISSGAFKKQIELISKMFPVVSLKSAAQQCLEERVLHKTQVVLTFDDGYRDNYEIAFPILREKGIPATFFLATDYIGNNKPLWDWELINMLNDGSTVDIIDTGDGQIHRKPQESGLAFGLRVFEKMKSMQPDAVQKIINFLKDRTKNNYRNNSARDSCLTWEQVRGLDQDGMEIGAHGLSHRALSRIPFKEAIDEINGSKRVIEDNIDKKCLYFAFPFGSKRDYNQDLVDYVKNSGFSSCLLNIHGYNHVEKNNFCFKRLIIKESTNLRYFLE